MKYDIKINQRAVIEQGLDLDFIDMAIFDCIACIFNCPEFPSITIPSEGNIFKWISTKKIMEELPLLKIGDKAIKLRIDKLVDCGLLIKYVWKEDGNKPYYAQGKLFSSMFRIDRNEYDGVGIKTTKGLEPERPRGWNLNDQGVGIKTTNYNNTNNNSINNNYTKNNEESENEFSPEPARTEKRRFSKENGLTPGNLNVRQSTIDKIDAAFEQLVFPIDDVEIKKLFFVLCCSPKWRGKTVHALQMSLNKVQNYDRDFTIKLIEDSIAGGWQGLVFENTDRKYQDYLKAKKGGISWGGGTTFTKMSDEERKEALEYLNL